MVAGRGRQRLRLVAERGDPKLLPEQVADLGAVLVDRRDEDVRRPLAGELDDQLGQVGLDRRNAGVVRLHMPQHRQTIHGGHADITQQHIHLVLLEVGQCFVPRGGGEHRIPRAAEERFQGAPMIMGIIHDQNAGHACLSSLPLRGQRATRLTAALPSHKDSWKPEVY